MLALALELLEGVGPLRSRAMFGGHAVYAQDCCVALIADEQLYLKADAETLPRFEAAGCEAFVFETAGKRIAMSYRRAPPEALESPALMAPWARLALAAALRARAAKPPRDSAPRRARSPSRG